MSLTSRTALVVSDRPGIQTRMAIYMKKAGIHNLSVAGTLREAVTKAQQELPHLILFFEDTADAPALHILEAVRKCPMLDRAIVFLVRNCNRDELTHSAQLRVASVLPKDVDANLLIEKVKQKLVLLGGLSPYALRGEHLRGGNQATLKIPIKIIGRSNNHVVCRSPLHAQVGATAFIHPDDSALDPFEVVFTVPSTDPTPDGHFHNYFSLHSIMGSGRAWLQSQLSDLHTPSSARKQRLLVFDRTRSCYEPMQKILGFHGIESELVDSIASLCSVLQSRADDFGAVYFSESLMGTVAAPWESFKKEAPPEKLPMELAVTTEQFPAPAPRTIWLRKPFGLDQVVQCFQAAMAHRSRGAETASIKPVGCQCVAPAKVVAIDEAGGILMSRLMPALNSEFLVDHPFLSEHPQLRAGRVVAAEPHTADPHWSLVRFVFSEAASSKEKYWSGVYRLLDAFRPVAAASGQASAASGQARPNPARTTASQSKAPEFRSITDSAPMPKFNPKPKE